MLPMPLEWAVCLRYLRAARSGGPVSFVTLVAALGVALGVAALVVAMACMNGYQVNLLRAMAGALPHVSLLPDMQSGFEDAEALEAEVIRAVHPRSIARYGSLDALIRKADAPAAPMQAVALRGIEPAIEARESDFLAFLDDGTPAWKTHSPEERLRRAGDLMRGLSLAASRSGGPVPILISHTVAARLGVTVGDRLTLLEFPTGSGFVPVPHGPPLSVHGLFETGILAFDEAIALTGLNSLMGLAPADQIEMSVGLRLELPLAAAQVADRLRALQPPNGNAFHVFSWLESNKSLFQVILLQKAMLFLVLMLIVVIASFGMVSALIMLVTEKTREITILKALGAPGRIVRRIFLLQGILIGVGGLCAGLVLGLFVCWVLASLPLFTIPPGVYPGSDRIPVLVSAMDVLWIVLGTVAIAAGATQFPAYNAMRIKPIEGLRHG